MKLEEEAKDFMDRRNKDPKTLFEVLIEMSHRLRECEKTLKEIKQSLLAIKSIKK